MLECEAGRGKLQVGGGRPSFEVVKNRSIEGKGWKRRAGGKRKSRARKKANLLCVGFGRFVGVLLLSNARPFLRWMKWTERCTGSRFECCADSWTGSECKR